ncbi:MAG: ribonuclease PH [Acidobacteria bacterium]|nr:ribonuclease PH [Acidobacteriota bacterium]MCI0624169.1 ribonuclease PH [Acidobacteriota bacterium]MCI0719745.1 ribonuclease PH [Acidobacteriota bacterium]
MRTDGRQADELRNVDIQPHFIRSAEGSALITVGNTRVICTASIENTVPSFLRGQGKGWVTSEYAMLPRATQIRTSRESTKGKPSGRTQEIQRLIGRSLRSVTQMEELGERTVWIDCDVIEADGGTRTASITGAFVALGLALQKLVNEGVLQKLPLRDYLAATSVGVVDGQLLLDLNYEEDSQAQVDMNLVETGGGLLVEVQGTAEGNPFSKDVFYQLITLGSDGTRQLVEVQKRLVHL